MTNPNEIVEACNRKDREAIRRLIQSIPENKWKAEAGLATAWLPPLTIRVWWAEGGSGINTYTKIQLSVELEDLERQAPPIFIGAFSDEELRIPNFIPRDVRRSVSTIAKLELKN